MYTRLVAREKEVTLLENILVRNEEGNALIVDSDESVSKTIVLRLLKKIRLGFTFTKLEHKSIVELDWNLLISESKTKNDLERL